MNIPRQCVSLFSVMIREAAEGVAGVYQAGGFCCHPLGPGCVDAWWWGGFQRLKFLELGVEWLLQPHLREAQW